MLSFSGQRVDYESWFAEHTITDNDEGQKELARPHWKLMDRFARTTDRCERLVYANSIPDATRPVMVLDPHYRTNACYGPDGSVVQLLDGTNNTFNRVDSTAQVLSWREGLSRATSQNDLMRLAWQHLFQFHQPWTPNLNGNARIVPDPENERRVLVPATTIDMKEHLTLSWLPREPQTSSAVMIISGTQNQTGTYSSAWGARKDITADPGLPGSQPDGTAKGVHELPYTASADWDLATAVSDTYVARLDAPPGLDSEAVIPAMRFNGQWQPLAPADCILHRAYESDMLALSPDVQPEACNDVPLVGYDPERGGSWWMVLDSDVELALVPVR